MSIHLVWSLFYLGIIITLLFLYFALPYGFVAFLTHFRKKRKMKKAGESLDGLRVNWQNHKKILFRVFLILLVINSLFYFHLRSEWMGKNNANYEAKEYFVVGQTLNSYKTILTTIFHPELPFIVPFTKLQWLIYNKGVALLPESDGEAGVWQNMWFHHHFGKKDRHYFGVKRNKPSPKMVEVLDQYWFSLKSMATKPFADKEMEEKYLKGFSGLAFSYILDDGFYSGKALGAYRRMAKNPIHVRRSELLLQWLNELRFKWQSSKELTQTVKDNPKLLTLAQLCILKKLEDIILAEIHAGEFNCNQPSIHQYLQIRKEFYSPDNGKPAYKNIKNKQERESIYYIAINSPGARDTRYLIENYCDFEVAGKVDMSFAVAFAKDKNITPERQEDLWCRASLREEIIIIEGVSGGRN